MATNDQKKQAREKREQAQAAAEAAQRRNRNLQMLGGAVVAAIAVVILVVIISGGKDTPDAGVAKGGELLGVTETKSLLDGVEQDGLTIGKASAPVTIVEFLDVQCPFCRSHQLDEQPKVITELVKTGKARVTIQPIALPQMGEDSEAGRTVALRLAQKDKAWDFFNLFFFNQGDEGTGYVTDAYLKQLVGAIPGTATTDAVRTPDEKITASLAKVDELSKTLGVTGTPSFAIGETGKPASGYKMITISGTEPIGDQLIEAVDGFKAN